MFGLGRKARLLYTAVEAITVPPEKEAEFVDWDRRHIQAMDGVPGFLGTETIAPEPPEKYAQAMSATPGFQGYQLQGPLGDLQSEWVDGGQAAIGDVERASADSAPLGAMQGASRATRRRNEQALLRRAPSRGIR